MSNINKRVFLRADLNVPTKDGKISQDYKLEAIVPTIKHIQEVGAKVVLATHIGRPDPGDKTNFFNENLSTKILVPWLEKAGFKVDHEVDLLKAIDKSKKDPDKILLLENLRFFKGEQETSDEFAELLRQLADYYVNDAFGVMHRQDTSVTLLPKKFGPDDRSYGPIVQKEIDILTQLKEKPKRPFVVVLGGNKLKTKIPFLDAILGRPDKKRVNKILLGGAIANEFLNKTPEAHAFLEKAKSYNVKIVLPVDGPQENDSFVDIGPETINLFKKELSDAKTVFMNGVMGIYEKPEYATGTKEVLKIIGRLNAKKIIGGGDAVAAAYQFEIAHRMTFLSTGGGATLAFLAGKLEILDN